MPMMPGLCSRACNLGWIVSGVQIVKRWHMQLLMAADTADACAQHHHQLLVHQQSAQVTFND